MATTKETKALKKNKSQFNIIGKVKITDKTFNLNNKYDSGWTDNSMYIGVDCGQGNLVYAEMRGGYNPSKENTIRAFSKDEKDASGKSKQTEIAWEDRLDESLFDTIAETNFVTVGIEKDTGGKTVYKKFLSAYDAVEYIHEHLEVGMAVNVRGNLKYSEYDGNVTIKKEITSIALSQKEESEYRATFVQSVLFDNSSIGKVDKEKSVVNINAYVVDYLGNIKIDDTKIEIKKNIVYPINLEMQVNEKNTTAVNFLLNKYIKVTKKGILNELVIEGDIVEGTATVEVTEADYPDDIKELIAMGVYTEEEYKGKVISFNGGKRERHMYLRRPATVSLGKDDSKVLGILFETGKYTDADLIFYEQIITENTPESNSEEVNVVEEDADILSMLDMN